MLRQQRNHQKRIEGDVLHHRTFHHKGSTHTNLIFSDSTINVRSESNSEESVVPTLPTIPIMKWTREYFTRQLSHTWTVLQQICGQVTTQAKKIFRLADAVFPAIFACSLWIIRTIYEILKGVVSLIAAGFGMIIGLLSGLFYELGTSAEQKRMDERLEVHGKTEVIMPGDGNCMMLSLSHQLYGDTRQHQEIRRHITEWLLTNEKFQIDKDTVLGDFLDRGLCPKWEQYCAIMSRNGTWGDHLALVAAAERYNLEIRIVSSIDAPLDPGSVVYITPKDNIPQRRTIWLSHWHENHYNSLIDTDPSGVEMDEDDEIHQERDQEEELDESTSEEQLMQRPRSQLLRKRILRSSKQPLKSKNKKLIERKSRRRFLRK
eukprot:TRINITY_DN3681_c0_g1_i1.p1 TRINITY_DN3681_c0_g1~~TRINITY_DN3681_c0_g1_i1.p1  ORF type:complete len:375 (-),score=42.61 TRINITY_DN3681_c0_g1_i1:79-1203(-)